MMDLRLSSDWMYQDILNVGGKDFAAGSGAGKQLDEQVTMAIALAELGTKYYPLVIPTVLAKVGDDYLDRTIPDGAYYKGWILANTSMKKYGWKAIQIKNKE